MSARKGYDTKIPVDDNTDSGFLSGEQIYSGELESGECTDPASDSYKVHSSSRNVDINLDSGLCLSESFSNLDLDTPTEQARLGTSTASAQESETEKKTPDFAVLNLLFEQDEDGDSQLHIAAVHGCEKTIGTIIKLCPDKSWLDMPNDYGHTALHLAVMSGHSVVTRMLVSAGASISARDEMGRTPLHLAAETCHVECIQALLHDSMTSKDHTTRKMSKLLNQKDYNGQTCVHVAANVGHIRTIQTLVYYGVDINAREGLAGRTALHIAARRGDARLAQYLAEQCPGVARGVKDWAGRTPRRLARKTHAAAVFSAYHDGSDTDSDDDDDYDSDNGSSLFEKPRDSPPLINVA